MKNAIIDDTYPHWQEGEDEVVITTGQGRASEEERNNDTF
jgi:hypothetical protein